MADDEDTTNSAATRWAYTNDVAALLLVAAFTAAVGAVSYAVATGQYDGTLDVGLMTLAFVALVLLAGTWLFGQDAIEALSKLRG